MNRAVLMIAAAMLGLTGATAARAEDGLKPICADRPTKGTSPCTDEPRHWQVEVDVLDLSHDRSGGVTTDAASFAGTTVKYGVSDRLDLELSITPLQTEAVSGARRVSGFGDMSVRAKMALTQGAIAISLLPSIKLPTATHGMGNGAVEGGLVAPIAFTLPGQTTLTLDPEVDVLKNGVGQGRHAAYAMAAGLSRPLTASVTGAVELWGSEDQAPGGHVNQASFDIGLAWIPMKDQSLQLDGGFNFGLNHATTDVQAYVGVSRRF